MKSSKLFPLKSVYFLIVMTCFCFTANLTAGPITQAFLTDHFFRLVPKYSDDEKNAFRAGSLFSDIYLLGKISKEEVTFPGTTLEDILSEPSPFFAGMKFHSLVNEARDAFVQSGNYEELLAPLNIAHPAVYLKFLEDQIIFPSVEKTHWKKVANQIYSEERQFGLDEEVLQRWHYLLDLSFSYYPSTLVFLAHLKGNGLLGIPPEEIAAWNATFEATSKEEYIGAYVGALLQMFASKIQQP